LAKSSDSAPATRLAATLALEEPVSSVKMVSPTRARALGKLGVSTVRDLVNHYPRRYIDMSKVCTIAQAAIGEQCTISGTVHELKLKKPKRNLVLVEISIVDSTGILMVTAFRQPWLAEQLKEGMSVAVAGKLEFNYGFKRMTNPLIEQLEQPGEVEGMIVPVHPSTGSIKAGMMRRLVANALAATRGQIDPVPLGLRTKYKLYSRQNALECIHFPQSMDEAVQARRRLVYEELLMLELVMMQEGDARSAGKAANAHVVDGPHMQALVAAVPFELTDEQVQARSEILDALSAGKAANHMLLGDVGTGKTIVAAFALAAVSDSGSQAAFMAPTEILARQHAASLGPLLDKAGITWEVLTGSTSPIEREAVLDRLAAGTIDVVFGTHALLEDDVRFSNLTLAVIDEQQRFGVDQRSSLLAKGECPDALFLTATPIPRTLALALFGNLSLSYIHKRPGAYAPRTTRVCTKHERGIAYDAALAALARGEQVYVVCPLVGDKANVGDEDGDAREQRQDEDAYEYASISIEDEADMALGNVAAAEAHAAFLQSKEFIDYKVGLVHGKLAAAEKQAVMQDFRDGNVQVLVATTVIEVGVDVPNATVMIVEDADRFGLAQLHQLRGRVGRGNLPSEVYLVSSSKTESAIKRLAAMEQTDDGFELATYDLSLRREGDILGNRQHGASALKLVNVVRDGKVIEAAHADAQRILTEDPKLESAMYRALGRESRIVYKRATEISGG